MSDALGNVAESFEKVSSGVKTVKLLRDKNLELSQMIEIAKKYARQIDKLDLPAELTEEKDLQDKLKLELQNMLHYWSGVSVQYKRLCDEIKKFEALLTANCRGSSIPPEVIKEFCEELSKISYLAKEFYDLFEVFVGFLSDSKWLAEKLTNKLKQRFDEAEKAASSSKKKGVAGIISLAALGTALGILGFFTGGTAWAAAGAVGATACGVGAGAVAYNSVVDVKALRQLAQDIKGCSDKLGDITKELENRVDTALHLDEEMAAALQNLLAFAISDQQRDDRIAQLEKENDDKDEEISRLKEQLRRQGNI